MCDGKTKVDITLDGAPPGLNANGSLGNDDTQQVVALQTDGSLKWSACLDEGNYTFVCNVSGTVGPAGIVTVVEHDSQVVLGKSDPNLSKISGTPGTRGNAAIPVPFPVGTPAAPGVGQ